MCETQNSNGSAKHRHYYFGYLVLLIAKTIELKVAHCATFNSMVLALELRVQVQVSQVELAEVVALRAQVVVVALSVLPQDC